jgi:hypothetical protein
LAGEPIAAYDVVGPQTSGARYWWIYLLVSALLTVGAIAARGIALIILPASVPVLVLSVYVGARLPRLPRRVVLVPGEVHFVAPRDAEVVPASDLELTRTGISGRFALRRSDAPERVLARVQTDDGAALVEHFRQAGVRLV